MNEGGRGIQRPTARELRTRHKWGGYNAETRTQRVRAARSLGAAWRRLAGRDERGERRRPKPRDFYPQHRLRLGYKGIGNNAPALYCTRVGHNQENGDLLGFLLIDVSQ